MKKIFISLALLYFAAAGFSQVARCDWMKVDSMDGSGAIRFIDNRWENLHGNPLQVLVTKCDCRCNKEVVMTGTFQFVGNPEFGVFHHILTVPAWMVPHQLYFGETACVVSTTNWPQGQVHINTVGEVYLAFPAAPLMPGTQIRVTMIFYIP